MVFLRDDVEIEITSDSDQQISIKILVPKHQKHMLILMVYAKCTENERIPLWNSIYNLANTNLSWLIGGDFNALINGEEKMGVLPVTQQ